MNGGYGEWFVVVLFLGRGFKGFRVLKVLKVLRVLKVLISLVLGGVG